MIAYRSLRYWFCITVLLLVLFPIHLRSNAQEGVFSETFDDPTLPGWEHSPEAQAVDGVLHIPSDNFAFHGGQWRDGIITLRARLSGEGELVIGYSMTDQAMYQVVLSAHSASLLRQTSDTVEVLMGTPSGAPLGEWFDLAISVADGEHSITLNGQLWLTGHDLAPLAPGGILLQARGGAVGEFDDLVLSAPQSQTVPEGGQPPQTANIPAYQAEAWVRTGGPIGGLGYDIRYNFADYNIWYVTDAWSGFYISADNGATWTPSNTGITARKGTDGIPIFSATVDPHNPNIIWIGTDLTGDIFKSSDGGQSWVEMTNGVDSTLRPMSFRGFTVDPRTSDIVYAMAEIGSPAWTPDHNPRKGLELDLTQGIVYKTTDGGQTWAQVWRGDNLARYAWIDPRNPDVVYVSTGIFDREAANSNAETGIAGGVGILKSTDGGQTWRVLNQDNGLLDLYIGSLYMSPQNPDVLLAAAGQNNWSRYGEQFTGGIYLTEDGGEHWERVIADDEIFSTVEYCVSDPNVAYAGSSRSIYRSDDGGQTWQRFTRADHTWGSPGVVAGFPIDMQCDPVDPMRIFINNYLGGNFLSTDGGQTWVLSSDGYTGELVNVVAAAQGGLVYVGSRSGVFRSDNGGDDWIGLVYPPEGMQAKFNEVVALAVDPADSNHLLAVPADLGGILYSTDGGQSWQMGSVFGPRQVVFAPNDPSIVYATTEFGLFVSHDGGLTWTPVPNEQVSGFAPPVVAVQPGDANTVYVSRPDVGILKTTDGGQTWTLLTTGLPQAPVLALAVDPANPQIIFATAGAGQASMGGGGVFRSTDGGLTWAQMSAGLPPEGLLLSVVIDPTNSQVVYVGDNFSGVFVSTDGGTTWNILNNGLQHREVKVLSISPDGRVLYAGTGGDGVYRLGTP